MFNNIYTGLIIHILIILIKKSKLHKYVRTLNYSYQFLYIILKAYLKNRQNKIYIKNIMSMYC